MPREVNDFTARIGLTELPTGREIHYRVRFEDLATGALSMPTNGMLRTPDINGTRTVRFAWSGDVGGQGYGINPEFGGLKVFNSIAALNPDMFIHCGDVVYADAPMRAQKSLGHGRVWHNLLIPEKTKVAETLAEFRAPI